jgi:hypothetical protein
LTTLLFLLSSPKRSHVLGPPDGTVQDICNDLPSTFCSLQEPVSNCLSADWGIQSQPTHSLLTSLLLVFQTVLLFLTMLRSWWELVLTTSQVINLARALPRPQGHGYFNANSSTALSHPIGSLALDTTIPGTGLSGPSPITFTDENLHVQVVTSTDLPSVQTPTATSATQSGPDTSGVSTSIQRTLLSSSDRLRRLYRALWKQEATPLSSHFRQVCLR